MKPPRLTLKKLADELGVSHTTVSLALRDHQSIPVATRDRIKRHARKRGYRPDPTLSALVAYRMRQRPRSFGGTLGWLTNHPSESGWKSGGLQGYFVGASRRADELGYQLDCIWLGESGLDSRGIRRILNSRGIRGLLFAPQVRPNTRLDLDVEGFAAVTFGYSLVEPRLHVVMNHQFSNMVRLLTGLFDKGYRRIGLAMPLASDERVNHNYVAGYWAARHFARKNEVIPFYLPRELRQASFMAWYRKYRPEVIVAETGNADHFCEFLREAGFAVPADVGMALVNIPYRNAFYSGIDENHELIGSAAVDVVSGMLYRHEFGLSSTPRHLLIDGELRWNGSLIR